MAYRDDLEAAHARIEALEAALALVGDDLDGARALGVRSAELERKIEAMRSDVGDLAARFERVRAAMQPAPGTMPTLVEYNRSTPPGERALSGEPAGVRCPWCLVLFDESVEMRLRGRLRLMLEQDGGAGVAGNTARCPRCDYMGLKVD